jgi:hypothetical protein
MIQYADTAGLDLISDLYANDMKLYAAADRHSWNRVADTFKAQELLVKLSRRLEIVTFERPMGNHVGLNN